jgi:hypothetical protein
VTTITITRTNIALPSDKELESASKLLFDCFKGFNLVDNKRWRQLWKKLIRMEPGEMLVIDMTFPRSGPYHRRHMAIEQTVFDAQERFQNFEQFRYWLKVGSGWVIWAAGPKGGVVPIPKSISYRNADEAEFRQYHVQVMEFLHGPHAAHYLWQHLDKPNEMMTKILQGFDE